MKKGVKNVIYIMIDKIRIKNKIKVNLNKESHSEIYYLINYDWFEKYLEYTNLKTLYNNETLNQKIENLISDFKQNTNEDVFLKILNLTELNDIINNKSINFSENNNIFKNIQISPRKISINNIFYYSDFILVSENTAKNLINNDKDRNSIKCYFGNNRIFILNNSPLLSVLFKNIL